jgi:DNA repair protein RecO (recombination protein O)
MPRFQDQALVLRRWDFSETSQTVVLYTRHHGLIRGLAKGSKRPQGNFSGGFEPLTCGQIQVIPKSTSDLALLTEWDLQEIFPAPRRSLTAHRWALCSADLVSRMLERDDPHPLLYDSLILFWRQLEQAQEEHAVVVFLLKLLDDTGHMPHLESLHALPPTKALGYDPSEGRFTEDPGPNNPNGVVWRIRHTTADSLCRISSEESPDESIVDTQRANRFLLSCLCWILGTEPESVQTVVSMAP